PRHRPAGRGRQGDVCGPGEVHPGEGRRRPERVGPAGDAREHHQPVFALTTMKDTLAETPNKFQRQLTVATLGLLFVVLVIYLLKELATILQPLLIAVLVAYVLMPVHRWLVRRGVRSKLAYGLM